MATFIALLNFTSEGIRDVKDSPDLTLEMANETETSQDRCPHLLIKKEASDVGIGDLFDLLTFHPQARVAGEDALNAQKMGGSVADELEPLPEEDPSRPFLFGVNVARGKNTQPEKVREPEGAPLIVDLLQPLILLDGGHVSEMDTVAPVHEAVNEPVPVER